MTSITQDFKKIKKTWGFFVLLVTFEVISHCSNIDSSHWLKEDDYWLTNTNFIDKFMVSKASTRSSRTFLLNFWFLLFLLLF